MPKLWGNDLLSYSLLDPEMDDLLAQGVLGYRLDAKGRKTYGDHNRFVVHRPSGVPVDIFIGDQQNFGMLYLVRTGPKEFKIRIMQRFRTLGMRGHVSGGVTSKHGDEITCPDEASVFELLQMPYISPDQRGRRT